MKLPEKNWLEWSCFAVSLILLATVLGYLTYETITCSDMPAAIELQLGAPAARGGDFVIQVTAQNHGDRTAKDVQVEVVLRKGGQEERAGFRLDYLPRHGRRDGYVTFQNDPGAADSLQARAVGYAAP